jgi:hypothetical protein
MPLVSCQYHLFSINYSACLEAEPSFHNPKRCEAVEMPLLSFDNCITIKNYDTEEAAHNREPACLLPLMTRKPLQPTLIIT